MYDLLLNWGRANGIPVPCVPSNVLRTQLLSHVMRDLLFQTVSPFTGETFVVGSGSYNDLLRWRRLGLFRTEAEFEERLFWAPRCAG